ncbi:MAG: hypothetical protein ACOX4I_00600 [Anaerovoracaceae bacterium]|jgi:hypothetical protein
MKITSAEANKMLRQLNDEHEKLLEREYKVATFNASLGEDPETVRPEYDYSAMQKQLGEVEAKIRKLKH